MSNLLSTWWSKSVWLRLIVIYSWYITNKTLHNDLNIHIIVSELALYSGMNSYHNPFIQYFIVYNKLYTIYRQRFYPEQKLIKLMFSSIIIIICYLSFVVRRKLLIVWKDRVPTLCVFHKNNDDMSLILSKLVYLLT